jgi:hypothetical protein
MSTEILERVASFPSISRSENIQTFEKKSHINLTVLVAYTIQTQESYIEDTIIVPENM